MGAGTGLPDQPAHGATCDCRAQGRGPGRHRAGTWRLRAPDPPRAARADRRELPAAPRRRTARFQRPGRRAGPATRATPAGGGRGRGTGGGCGPTGSRGDHGGDRSAAAVPGRGPAGGAVRQLLSRGAGTRHPAGRAASDPGWCARCHRRSGRADPAPGRKIGRRAHRPDADPCGSHCVAALARGPVVRVLRTIYDVDATPLEVQDSVAAADRHEFRYDVDMR